MKRSFSQTAIRNGKKVKLWRLLCEFCHQEYIKDLSEHGDAHDCKAPRHDDGDVYDLRCDEKHGDGR